MYVFIKIRSLASGGEGAAGVSFGAVHMEGVQVRVQVECGREVEDGERNTEEVRTRKQQRMDDQTLIMDGMKME